MPSATRAEALIGIQEVIDKPHESDAASSGQALRARQSLIKAFPSLGPPDMLYMRKRYVPVVGAEKVAGYYHFVRGVEPVNVAKISAYIVDVVRNRGLDPLTWSFGGGWEIASATFVAYNFISKADLIVHVDFPGSTTATATDMHGKELPLSDMFWHELHVSSVIRDITSHGEQPLYPCLRVISSNGIRSEPQFLDAALECAPRWMLAGADGPQPAVDDASSSRIARALRDHFLSSGRYDVAEEFFLDERLTNVDKNCPVFAAAASRVKGDLDHAMEIVDQVIESGSKSKLAWMERAKILKARGELEKSLEAAKMASSFAGQDVEVWAFLADLYADLKEYSKAFEALNSADMPPPALDPYLRGVVRNRKNLTVPIEGASNGTDAVCVLAQKLRDEKTYSSEKTDASLSELPAKLMNDDEKLCYSVLVKMWNHISWDEMLAVRGGCFVMETDVRSGQLDDDVDDGDDEDGHGMENPPDLGEESNGNSNAGTENGAENGENMTEDIANGVSTISLHDDDDAHSSDEVAKGTSANGDSYQTELRKRTLEKIGKKVCKPWLDFLVTNMYHDLRALALWNAEEQQNSAAAAIAANALTRRPLVHGNDGDESSGETPDLEAQATDQTFRRTPEDIVKTTKRPPADWLRRGELALRLGKIAEAKTAFLVCVKLGEREKNVAVTALCRIMKMSSEDGDASTTLRCADAIWNYMDACTDRKLSSEPSPPVPEVRRAVFILISKMGLRAVRDVVTDKVEVDRKRLEGLLLDSVSFRVHGFSR